MEDGKLERPEDRTEISKAILAVMGEVGYVQKTKVPELRYTFASEVDLIRALRPAMIENGLICFVHEITELRRETYTTKNGSAMNLTVARGVVRFVHAPSGQYIDVEAMGEGSDVGDKSANKASTGLLKYALRQTFLIETGDDPDTEPSQEAAAKPVAQAATPPAKTASVQRPAEPETVLDWITRKARKFLDDGKAANPKQKGLAVGCLELCFAGDEQSRAKRHAVQAYMTGEPDTDKIDGAFWLAILDYLKPTKDSGDAYAPDPMAVKEVRAIAEKFPLDLPE